MQRVLIGLMLLLACSLPAKEMPDHLFFRAMRDEMSRTVKDLRVKGAPKPSFVVYQLVQTQGQRLTSSLGATVPSVQQFLPSLSANVYLYVGDFQTNNHGFLAEDGGQGVYSVKAPASYEGIRRALWRATDAQYNRAATLYDKKVAYKRQKKIENEVPDFSRTPKAFYTEEIPVFKPVDTVAYQDWLNELSALGKEYSFVENFEVVFLNQQKDKYFLDSEGDFAQTSFSDQALVLYIRFHTEKGYLMSWREPIALVSSSVFPHKDVKGKVQEFLERAQQVYYAAPADSYIGPVLLRPQAAAKLFRRYFVGNVSYTKPFLSVRENNYKEGSFRQRVGMRVISPLFDVYDKPSARVYKGQILQGFMGLDDEGVKPQDLHLVQQGKLISLPAARSPLDKKSFSNGHARIGFGIPREFLSNVFFVPKKKLGEEALEKEFLEICKKQELEYCYILPDLNGDFAQKIYVQDGRKEWVSGLVLSGLNERSLRGILAAGEDEKVTNDSSAWAPLSIIAPSIVLDEIEIMPTQKKPDRKPFVPLPR